MSRSNLSPSQQHNKTASKSVLLFITNTTSQANSEDSDERGSSIHAKFNIHGIAHFLSHYDTQGNDGFCRRCGYRMSSFGLGVLAWFPAGLILAVAFSILAGLKGAVGQSEHKENKRSLVIMSSLYCILVVQPIGALVSTFASRWRDSFLPVSPRDRPITSKAIKFLIAATCCFGDDLLTNDQAFVLCVVEVLISAGFIITMSGGFSAFLYLKINPSSSINYRWWDVAILVVAMLVASGWYLLMPKLVTLRFGPSNTIDNSRVSQEDNMTEVTGILEVEDSIELKQED